MGPLGAIYSFFGVHLGFHEAVLIRISLGFPLGSLGFHVGYKKERIKQIKEKHQEAAKMGSREAEEQEIEQQHRMTEKKNVTC